MISCEMYAVFSLLIRKAQKYPILFPYHFDKNIIAYSALIYNERWMSSNPASFSIGEEKYKMRIPIKKVGQIIK